MVNQQHTIGAPIIFTGVGVHGGAPVEMTLHPAEPDTGIVFHVFEASGLIHEIAAVSANVSSTDLSTIVGDRKGAHVATIEHIMAALYAMDVDNVIVQIDGNEVPILGGGSAEFVRGIEGAGLVMQRARRRFLRVLKPVRVELNGGWAEYRPYEGTRFEVEIDFASRAIGRQCFAADLSATLFRDELAEARTFGFMKDVEKLWASGHALGSSLDNSVVIGDDERVINPAGLRFADEFVRHKTLDAVGDQALAGSRILGCYRSYRGGHRLNALALAALTADPSAFELVELPARWPETLRRSSARAAAVPSLGAAAPAFGPQIL
ncbi:UDP-3-O-acyl-N-acetylglucosamine deacetylase [Aureimonas jatrophae]|uniref:UDP-3-O-acyl-N-acetylglucosamine deacetylase n=1 Tax=Aureimonas jatrophae TaxID=1166073 RepID=A0A1H0CER8_9HYPH|nr:UDP-3-O-acyl-N-acetylglucosamine deacetylase [Aureimonas jatrophae]MBB3949199.1 UDP-3-O-[3-hydroxymyristoyl] N-acetylglucosamine deacetylase [Aureimonas jatrophae]SDN56271.1 UDP-3-O-[3-hydroxymyristoyl] N-acetylglucosamine deacetylase [Aureimonas jatrophae]